MPGKHNHYRDKSFERGYMSAGSTRRGTVEALQELGDNVLAAAVKSLAAGADVIAADAADLDGFFLWADYRIWTEWALIPISGL